MTFLSSENAYHVRHQDDYRTKYPESGVPPRKAYSDLRKQKLYSFSKQLQINLHSLSNTHAKAQSLDKKTRAVCAISQFHELQKQYWYSLHPEQIEFLKDAEKSYLLLTFTENESLYALPFDLFNTILPYLNTTKLLNRGEYYHIRLVCDDAGENPEFHLPKMTSFSKNERFALMHEFKIL